VKDHDLSGRSKTGMKGERGRGGGGGKGVLDLLFLGTNCKPAYSWAFFRLILHF